MKFSRIASECFCWPKVPTPWLIVVTLFFQMVRSVVAAEVPEAEIRINEFLADNVTVFPDNADFDDYSDWIELHNPTDQDVGLGGYYITDDLTAPLKWAFPSETVIPAGGYLVVRADGFDAVPGETHVRGYFPWGSTFVTRRHHTSFKLSAEGEELGLFRFDGGPEEVVLINRNSVWSFHDSGTDPGADWMTSTFDDSGWNTGPGILGYGDSWVATTVNFGDDAENKFATTHFRHRFTVVDPSRVGSVSLDVVLDDGGIIYLNGTEIARVRMPAGPVSHTDYSGIQVQSENVYETIELPPVAFVQGENVLAVEVHQEDGRSGDVSFDAELKILLLPETLILVDSVSFGRQLPDVSFGRDPDAEGGWSFQGVPTPAAANAIPGLMLPAQTVASVQASLAGGFYMGEQVVELSSSLPESVIRFTLDGSVPGLASEVYVDPLTITNTTVLRARAFSDGWIPSEVLTRSYFLDADSETTLPVFSFVADPETLFGDDIGIYENDTSYVFKGREIPIRLEMFESTGESAFAISAGARIAGENIWRKAQKPFNIYMRSKYGDDLLGYQLFPDQSVGTFGEFNLRNGGDDWEETLLRDAMMPSILEGQMTASFYTYRPSVLFLNGQFWGIYNIRKRFDPVYFANEHYLAEGDYDLVQYAHVNTGSTVLHADTGSTERYLALREFVSTNDLADDAIYDQVLETVNVDSFIDYVVATDFAVNTSWSHNREFWSGRAPGSKWQWIINDFDRGFNMTNIGGSLIDNFSGSYVLFQRLETSPRFIDRLMQRYAAHIGSTFHPDRFYPLLDILSAEQEGEIVRHIERWGGSGGIATAEKRQDELDEIKQFVLERPTHALARLQEELNVEREMATLTFGSAPLDGGSVLIAGVPMDHTINAEVGMFLDTPVTLSAAPAPGFAFEGWSTGETEMEINIVLTNAMEITAIFTPDAEIILPSIVDTDLELTIEGSPYAIADQMTVAEGAHLDIGPGVELRMARRAGITVRGSMQVAGSESDPVRFVSRSGDPWGNLSFVNTSGPSVLSHVVIRDATLSRHDPLNLKAAVSGYNAELVLDHVDIEGPQPIFARFGSTVLRDSYIHITFTGDGINIKNGAGAVERTTFLGNNSVDTDAIDFDGVVDGLISDNRIFSFRGPNSDGIDVGEECLNLLVIGNRIYNNSDKGISVGQASEVFIERNLIVGCMLGIGIKDTGSIAYLDQNTFALNGVAVAVYEKNLGAGGGNAVVSNSIFSRSKDAPVTVDSLSTLSVTYSLSDTSPIVGSGNMVADPMFADPGIYDFSLKEGSPAIDAGDPDHEADQDGSPADIGAYHVYDANDYPFLPPNVVVINEVMAHSEGGPDWIELFNTSGEPVDVGGWFLSDSGSDLQRYRIADGTVIPGNGYLVFHEDNSFGEGSLDPGRLVPFALSENGETVHLYSPGDGVMLDYHEQESFGPSATGVSKGRYFKASSNTFNFVALETPTPGAANSLPLVGPIVISEIMYHPVDNADAEYIELLNISDSEITLYETNKDASWAMTDGMEFSFPTDAPLTLVVGERILLTRSETALRTAYSIPDEVRVFQWTSGALSNDGERLELSNPGDLDIDLIQHFVRVDRVNYQDGAPWPVEADGTGMSLVRLDERAYGNDSANWLAAIPTPGGSRLIGFDLWAVLQQLPAELSGWMDDPDLDGIANIFEFVYGNDPMQADVVPAPRIEFVDGAWVVSFEVGSEIEGLHATIQQSSTLTGNDWVDVQMDSGQGGDIEGLVSATVDSSDQMFFRLRISDL